MIIKNINHSKTCKKGTKGVGFGVLILFLHVVKEMMEWNKYSVRYIKALIITCDDIVKCFMKWYVHFGHMRIFFMILVHIHHNAVSVACNYLTPTWFFLFFSWGNSTFVLHGVHHAGGHSCCLPTYYSVRSIKKIYAQQPTVHDGGHRSHGSLILSGFQNLWYPPVTLTRTTLSLCVCAPSSRQIQFRFCTFL
jgi:hypothetical protein